MRLDKFKSIFIKILKNSLIPSMFFVCSFATVVSCFVNPCNYSSLAELVANDIQHVNKHDDYVHFELKKKKQDYNFIHNQNYYFERISELNKIGKEYAVFMEKTSVYDDGVKMHEYGVDYVLGITNESGFSKLDISFISGSIDIANYQQETSSNHCVISKGFADIINPSSDYEKIIGNSVKYCGNTFIIDAVAGNNFFSDSSISKQDTFIIVKAAKIISKEVDFRYNLFLKPSRYFDNYSILKIFFSNIYRELNDPYLDLFINAAPWIIDDINWYRVYGTQGVTPDNIKQFIIISCSIFLLGLLIGFISKKYLNIPSHSKNSFYLFITGTFLYFFGIYLWKWIFDGKLIGGLHISLLTAYSSFFAIVFFLLILNATLVPCVLLEKSDEPEIIDGPLVSIIIPVYNGSDYLKFAIESALSQTYKNIEVIIVNDGSNDNDKTRNIASFYKDERILYLEKENGGVSSALNAGIDVSKGKYICWLSHDDILPESKINDQISLVTKLNNESIIPYSKVIVIDENGDKANWRKQFFFNNISKLGGKRPCDYFKFNNLIFGSLLVPSDYLKVHKFRVDLTYSQDVFSIFEMLKNGYKLRYSKCGYIKYRVHSKQGSFTRKDQVSENAILMFKYFKEYLIGSNDVKFARKYLYSVAKKCSILPVYKEILQELIEGSERYGIKKRNLIKAKIITFFSKYMYKIKIKMLGR